VALLWLHVRLGVQHELAYRANLVAQVAASTVLLTTSLAFAAIVYGHVDAVAGWRPPELLLLWGGFFVLHGLLTAIVQPSLRRFLDDLRLGTFDVVLTRPVDAQLYASVRQVEVPRLVDVALGVGLIVVALAALGEPIGLAQAVSVVLALAAGEWSIKEVVGHLIDAERAFGFRAFAFSRAEAAALPGFEQDAYVREAGFDARPLVDLLDELALLRRANLLAFKHLTPDQSARRGTASGREVSVRALIYIIAGHVDYHLEDLRQKYLPALR
jgi:ABC-type uncharacterized transport system permease subunit